MLVLNLENEQFQQKIIENPWHINYY